MTSIFSIVFNFHFSRFFNILIVFMFQYVILHYGHHYCMCLQLFYVFLHFVNGVPDFCLFTLCFLWCLLWCLSFLLLCLLRCLLWCILWLLLCIRLWILKHYAYDCANYNKMHIIMFMIMIIIAWCIVLCSLWRYTYWYAYGYAHCNIMHIIQHIILICIFLCISKSYEYAYA